MKSRHQARSPAAGCFEGRRLGAFKPLGATGAGPAAMRPAVPLVPGVILLRRPSGGGGRRPNSSRLPPTSRRSREGALL